MHQTPSTAPLKGALHSWSQDPRPRSHLGSLALAVPGILPFLARDARHVKATLQQYWWAKLKRQFMVPLVSPQGVVSPPLLKGCGQELHGLQLYRDQGTASGVLRTAGCSPSHQPLIAMWGISPRPLAGPGALANFKKSQWASASKANTHIHSCQKSVPDLATKRVPTTAHPHLDRDWHDDGVKNETANLKGDCIKATRGPDTQE